MYEYTEHEDYYETLDLITEKVQWKVGVDLREYQGGCEDGTGHVVQLVAESELCGFGGRGDGATTVDDTESLVAKSK